MPYHVLATGECNELVIEAAETARLAIELATSLECAGCHTLKVMTPDHDIFDQATFEKMQGDPVDRLGADPQVIPQRAVCSGG